MKAQLILENGVVFNGNAFGHLEETVGENISEILYENVNAGYDSGFIPTLFILEESFSLLHSGLVCVRHIS